MPNSKRKCSCGCGDFERRENMLITPNGAAFINADHAAAYGKERAARLRARKERDERKVFKERKRKFYEKDHSHQFQLTKQAAQALANALDKDLPCICCSEPRGSAQFCGGHFKTAGAHPELALDLLNIHGQRNTLCNQHKSGNIEGDKNSHGFKRGLVGRYGQWIVDYLEQYHAPRKFTCEQLIQMRKEFAAETRRLKQGLPPTKNWRAISAITQQEDRAA